MVRSFPFWAQYATPKTITTELILGTRHGILSLKHIASKGRASKAKVYSGFEPRTWELVNDLPTSSLTGESFYQHRYIEAMRAALNRHHGKSSALNFCELGDIWDLKEIDNGVMSDISDAIMDDPGVNKHWRMISGEIAPASSSPKATQKAQARQETQAERNRQMIASDSMWGIF